MNKKIYKILIFVLIIMITSCKGIPFENQKIAKAEEFTKGEAMIFVAEEKNKYENKFGEEMWNLRSGDGNAYFKDYVVSNIKKFIETIMKLKLISDDLNIITSNSDDENLEKASDEYFSYLTNEDIDYIGCTKEDVVSAFTDFHIARLTIDNLSKNATSELSISEAKVIKVQYIIFDDKKRAEDTYEALKARGASFSYFAKTRSIDTEIEMIIKRGDEMSTKFPELFYLSSGQTSEILNSGNNYYIFKCISDYMVSETEDRRMEILKVMKNDEYNENYERYAEGYQLRSNSTYWKEIDLALGNKCKIYKFEEIYYKYFPRNIK